MTDTTRDAYTELQAKFLGSIRHELLRLWTIEAAAKMWASQCHNDSCSCKCDECMDLAAALDQETKP